MVFTEGDKHMLMIHNVGYNKIGDVGLKFLLSSKIANQSESL